ncbi:MAG: hypothetical protein ABFD50_15390 [Smithella sp.]
MPLVQMHEFGEDDKLAAAGYAMSPSASQSNPPVDTEMQATIESNIAPLWLVFPEAIINTQNITSVERYENRVLIYLKDMRMVTITPSDIEKTWSALQKVFSEGAS